MHITYFSRRVYGQPRYYIAEGNNAAAIKVLTGYQTVTKDQLKALENLGHEVSQVLPPKP